jgi:hypothetical protein
MGYRYDRRGFIKLLRFVDSRRTFYSLRLRFNCYDSITIATRMFINLVLISSQAHAFIVVTTWFLVVSSFLSTWLFKDAKIYSFPSEYVGNDRFFSPSDTCWCPSVLSIGGRRCMYVNEGYCSVEQIIAWGFKAYLSFRQLKRYRKVS